MDWNIYIYIYIYYDVLLLNELIPRKPLSSIYSSCLFVMLNSLLGAFYTHRVVCVFISCYYLLHLFIPPLCIFFLQPLSIQHILLHSLITQSLKCSKKLRTQMLAISFIYVFKTFPYLIILQQAYLSSFFRAYW